MQGHELLVTKVSMSFKADALLYIPPGTAASLPCSNHCQAVGPPEAGADRVGTASCW